MRVLLIANEPLLPVTNGGRARMLGIARSLAYSGDLHTAEPLARAPDQTARVTAQGRSLPSSLDSQHGITRHFIDQKVGRGLRYFASPKPRLGFTCLGRDGLRDLQVLMLDLAPEVVAVSHSYLAPRVRPLVPDRTTFLVDFANIEHQRLKSLRELGRLRNRVSARWESRKAASWERRVARGADVCVAVDDHDHSSLLAWGAKNACVVPNSVDRVPSYTPSPANGPALFLGSGDYGPNRAGAQWLLDVVWPQVRARKPEAQLWVAGWGTEKTCSDIPALGVRVLGGVEDLSQIVNSCAVCVVPVLSGGGTQLKLLDVLARHRTVVATGFSSRSMPGRAIDHCYVEDTGPGFAEAVVSALKDVPGRRARETMVARHVPVWSDSVRSLSDLLQDRQPPLGGRR
jgi:polysaccharide biosynthesis protein PslH